MKSITLTCFAAAVIALSAFGQTPSPAPDAAVAPPAPAVQPATPPPPAPALAAPTVTPPDPDSLESQIGRKARKTERGLSITFGEDEERREADVERKERDRDRARDRARNVDTSFDDSALMAIPIVGIIFSTLFGAPVMIVGIIMFFSFWKARSLHRTVRLMVEKGQPVPEALFATPHSPAKQRSDMRRGVVLAMVGLGLMLFLGAVNDWEGGAWSLGLIPFLIGVGYLLVWKLEGNKRSTDNLPPLL